MNLNQTKNETDQLERFNPKAPQGTVTTSFRPAWKTFVGGILADGAVSEIIAFSVSGLSNGGRFLDLRATTPSASVSPAPVATPASEVR